MKKKTAKAKLKAVKRRVARQQKSQKTKVAQRQAKQAEAVQVKKDNRKVRAVLHGMVCEMLKAALPSETRKEIEESHVSDAADFCVSLGFTGDGEGMVPNADIEQMAALLVKEVDEQIALRLEDTDL